MNELLLKIDTFIFSGHIAEIQRKQGEEERAALDARDGAGIIKREFELKLQTYDNSKE